MFILPIVIFQYAATGARRQRHILVGPPSCTTCQTEPRNQQFHIIKKGRPPSLSTASARLARREAAGACVGQRWSRSSFEGEEPCSSTRLHRLATTTAGVSFSWVLFEGARAVSYVGRYDDKSPMEALGIFRSRIRRVWGHAAIFAWSDLILNRSRKVL